MAKRWTQPKCRSMDEWTSKMWSVHTMDASSAIRRTEALIHAQYRGNTAFHELLFSRSVASDPFATLWTVASQAVLSMGFPRQEH